MVFLWSYRPKIDLKFPKIRPHLLRGCDMVSKVDVKWKKNNHGLLWDLLLVMKKIEPNGVTPKGSIIFNLLHFPQHFFQTE